MMGKLSSSGSYPRRSAPKLGRALGENQRDAAEVAWQVERTQLRARIKQLKDENKALHLQLGQLHAAFASSVSSFRDHDEARGGGAISDEMVHDEAGRRHAKGHGTPEG